MKVIWLESLLNLQASHIVCFEFLKCFVYIFIKGNTMPINRTFVKQLNWGTTPTPNFINLISLESLLRVVSNHHHGWVIWKPFKIQMQMGKG